MKIRKFKVQISDLEIENLLKKAITDMYMIGKNLEIISILAPDLPNSHNIKSLDLIIEMEDTNS